MFARIPCRAYNTLRPVGIFVGELLFICVGQNWCISRATSKGRDVNAHPDDDEVAIYRILSTDRYMPSTQSSIFSPKVPPKNM